VNGPADAAVAAPDAAVATMAPAPRPAGPDAFTLPDASELDVAPAGKVLVYAHSATDLFQVDPQTLEVTRVGPFQLHTPKGLKYIGYVTDIAIDRRGRMLGLRSDQSTMIDDLLEIDPATAECTQLAVLPERRGFNGLSWIRNQQGEEILTAAAWDGTLHRIDPTTGAPQLIGSFGPGLHSSGDLVWVAGHGALATVNTGEDQIDSLARIDTATGKATLIGPTGARSVYGLGFWGNRVFGFTVEGGLLLIDPKTGAGMEVQKVTFTRFSGAGVTTSVPVIP
jgi:hypothetical protein